MLIGFDLIQSDESEGEVGLICEGGVSHLTTALQSDNQRELTLQTCYIFRDTYVSILLPVVLPTVVTSFNLCLYGVVKTLN